MQEGLTVFFTVFNVGAMIVTLTAFGSTRAAERRMKRDHESIMETLAVRERSLERDYLAVLDRIAPRRDDRV